MEIFGIGLPEIILILVVALVIFGPEKLPEIAGQAGRMIRQFRQMTAEATSEIKSLTEDLKLNESLEEIKSAATMVREEVTTVKNDVTGTLTEQYKVTYETLTDPLKPEEKLPEGGEVAEPESAETTGTVTATAREFTDAERDKFNRHRLEELAFSPPAEQNLIDSAVESSPATSSLAETLDNTVEVTPDYQGAADAGPVEGETVARPKPRIARRSAFGGARQRERD